MGYYWGTTAGNHDSEAELNRKQVSEFDRSYKMSLTKPNSADISNEFNYMLPVYDETGEEIVQRLWFLDTGVSDCLGVPGYGCAEPD